MKWEDFLFLLCSQNEKLILSYLQRPYKLSLPLDVDKLDLFVKHASYLLPSSLNPIFERVILAHILIHNNRPDLIDWAKRYFVLEKILPELTWEAIEHSRWNRVLFPVTGAEGAKIICLITGVIDISCALLYPSWAREIFSLESITTLKQTTDMILTRTGSDNSVYFFPLLNQGLKIEGGSFALGFALILLSLLRDEEIYQNFIATGGLRLCDGDIYVEDVGAIEEKYKIVKYDRFPLFIVPYSNFGMRMQKSDSLPQVVCVRKLDHAWMWVKLYNKTDLDELKRIELLTTPAGFVDNCRGVKYETLSWFLNEVQTQDLIDKIITDKKI
jgi:hypothetical protein